MVPVVLPHLVSAALMLPLMLPSQPAETKTSVITDHCKQENHIMVWEKAKVVHMENIRHQRWITEAVATGKPAYIAVN